MNKRFFYSLFRSILNQRGSITPSGVETLTFALEYDSDDQIPEPVKPLYKQTDTGKFVLNAVSKAEFNERTNNNKKLFEENKAFQAKLKELEPVLGELPKLRQSHEELTKLKEQQLAEEEKALLTKGDLKVTDVIERQVQAKMAQWRTDQEQQLKTKDSMIEKLTNENKQYRESQDKLEVKYNISTAIDNLKIAKLVEAKADDEISPREILIKTANEVWRREADENGNERLVPRDRNGMIITSKKGTGEPISYSEWVELQTKKMSYLFMPSEGNAGNIGNGLTNRSGSGNTLSNEQIMRNPSLAIAAGLGSGSKKS